MKVNYDDQGNILSTYVDYVDSLGLRHQSYIDHCQSENSFGIIYGPDGQVLSCGEHKIKDTSVSVQCNSFYSVSRIRHPLLRKKILESRYGPWFVEKFYFLEKHGLLDCELIPDWD